jgi:hypothetical protein
VVACELRNEALPAAALEAVWTVHRDWRCSPTEAVLHDGGFSSRWRQVLPARAQGCTLSLQMRRHRTSLGQCSSVLDVATNNMLSW